jgi:hypothetical protein
MEILYVVAVEISTAVLKFLQLTFTAVWCNLIDPVRHVSNPDPLLGQPSVVECVSQRDEPSTQPWTGIGVNGIFAFYFSLITKGPKRGSQQEARHRLHLYMQS